uniref:(northern house mosquito) hypothetical protein n=1 Tax=Culex pipiens TaxID=7175 RepID=A0A8D8NFW0_CULPI
MSSDSIVSPLLASTNRTRRKTSITSDHSLFRWPITRHHYHKPITTNLCLLYSPSLFVKLARELRVSMFIRERKRFISILFSLNSLNEVPAHRTFKNLRFHLFSLISCTARVTFICFCMHFSSSLMH